MTGFPSDHNLPIHDPILVARLEVIGQVAGALAERVAVIDRQFNLLYANHMARCGQTPAGSARWVVTDRSTADVVIVVRMDPANEQPSDYYLIPRMGIDLRHLKLCEHNGARIDTYRFDTLSFLMGMATLLPIEGAA